MAQATSPPSDNKAPNKDFSLYALSFIGILITLGFGSLPPIDPITPLGMKVIGVFLGMIFLWSFVGLLWPSLLGIISLGILGYAPMSKVLASSFGSPVVVLIFFAMILFGAFEHYGISRYISHWFLTRKIINGKPTVFNFVFLYTTYILAALAATILPTILLMWSVLYSILNDVGYKKGDAYSNIMVIGVLFAAISGQCAKPFLGSALLILSSYEKVAGAPIDYLPYMGFGFIINTIAIFLFTLIIKYIIKPDMSKIADINIEFFKKNPLPPMDKRQKILFGCLFAFLILVLLPSILPTSVPGIGILKSLGPWGVTIAFVIGLTIYKIDSKPVINFKEMSAKYIGWDVYILVAMCMVIAGALLSPGTGIKEFISGIVQPLLSGLSPFVTTLMIIISGVAITQVANNGVMGAVLMPIIGIICMEAGLNFAAVATMMTFAMHLAILTPAASPYAAVLYANTDWLEKGTIFKYGWFVVILTMTLYATIGYPLVNIFFAA